MSRAWPWRKRSAPGSARGTGHTRMLFSPTSPPPCRKVKKRERQRLGARYIKTGARIKLLSTAAPCRTLRLPLTPPLSLLRRRTRSLQWPTSSPGCKRSRRPCPRRLWRVRSHRRQRPCLGPSPLSLSLSRPRRRQTRRRPLRAISYLLCQTAPTGRCRSASCTREEPTGAREVAAPI